MKHKDQLKTASEKVLISDIGYSVHRCTLEESRMFLVSFASYFIRVLSSYSFNYDSLSQTTLQSSSKGIQWNQLQRLDSLFLHGICFVKLKFSCRMFLSRVAWEHIQKISCVFIYEKIVNLIIIITWWYIWEKRNDL